MLQVCNLWEAQENSKGTDRKLSLYLAPCQEYLKPETPTLISRIQQFGGKGIYLSVNTDFYHSYLLCKVKSQQILQFIKFGLGAHNLTHLKPNLTQGLAHDKTLFPNFEIPILLQ